MNDPSAFNEQERADLVAYLDGELEGEGARAIEQKLALDPAAREEAEALKRTWELLDFLPKSEPSADFAAQTLTRLGPALTLAVPVTSRKARRWRRALVGTGWAAALILAALGGFYGFNRIAPAEPGDPELARDLNVVKNRRVFELVEDLDGVRELDTAELFGADGPGS
jgi:anti-sigma factor RsiW